MYTWNLHRFQQQLAKMRQVLVVKDKPNYSVHLSVHTPFADNPAPSYSCIGAARVPLRLLSHQISHTVTIPIFCAYTMEAIGSCRVDFKCTPVSGSGVATPDSMATANGTVLRAPPFGQKFVFTVTVDNVRGLGSDDFAEVHAQTRLSSLVGPSIASEDTFASAAVKLDKVSVSHLSLRRSLSVLVTSDMVSHLATGYATVEFFARVRDAYLERLERFDITKEKDRAAELKQLEQQSQTNSGTATPDRPQMRRAETEVVKTQHHDLLASVEVLEMGADGEYDAAEVEDDIVQLHLGVQRQLRVTLAHSSGRTLEWTRIVHGSVGSVRMLPKDGGLPITVDSKDVTLQLSSTVQYNSDGTAQLMARGTWDSAAHHCAQLDKRTRSEETIIVKMTFMVEIEGVDEPAILPLDMRVRIIGRDVRRSSLRAFWRARPVHNVVAIYTVDLTPPMARTARELWRLDTAKKPVPGENLLGGWRPRSMALVREYATLVRTRRAIADVQTTKVVLDAIAADDIKETSSDDEAARNKLLGRCLGMWQREINTRIEVSTVVVTLKTLGCGAGAPPRVACPLPSSCDLGHGLTRSLSLTSRRKARPKRSCSSVCVVSCPTLSRDWSRPYAKSHQSGYHQAFVFFLSQCCCSLPMHMERGASDCRHEWTGGALVHLVAAVPLCSGTYRSQ